MSFARYPAYQHLSLDWPMEVPSHWSVVRLKALLYEVDERTFGVSMELLGLSKSLGVVRRADLQQGAAVADSYEDYKVVRPGQIVMNKMQAWNGVFGLSAHEGMISPDYSVFGVRDPRLASYLAALLRTDSMAGVFFSRSRGMGTAFLRLNTQDFLDVRVPLPSLDEVAAIATYLDRQLCTIDGLVAEQRRLTDLLQEKREAVISHAVTKGLNPDAPIKPSGVEWLGEVPSHWDAGPLRRVPCLIQTGPFGSQLHAEDYIDGGTPIINPMHMVGGCAIASDDATVSEEVLQRLAHQRFRRGDIVLARRGALGHCVVIGEREEGWLCGTGSMIVRLMTDVLLPEFLALYFRSNLIQQYFVSLSSGATMDSLNTSLVLATPVVVPPREEQQAIVDWVRTETAMLDALHLEADGAITLLEERRAALISAAVTGQIDVRQLAAAEAA